VIRTADLGLVAADPTVVQAQATAMVEELGGYVVSSDLARSTRPGPNGDLPNDPETELTVNMVLRVPAEHFTDALARIRALGAHTVQDRVSSEDVSEEFIDLKARIVAQKALEAQLLDILKQVKSVKDALEVNTQLAEVRAAIEKLEGRRQFLESQTSFSTIKLAIDQREPLVVAGDFTFGRTVSHAGADVLNISAAIVHGVIRMLGVLVPIFALLVLPGALLGRALYRRVRRQPARA
jgi:hypothetical protein